VAKEDNLMPIEEVNSNRTREQHSADSRKGGIASGKTRREKATMKKTLEMLLNSTDKNNALYKDNVTLGLIANAIDKTKGGSPEAYKTIMAVLGELETKDTEPKRLDITIKDNSHLEKVMYEEE
jgi:hypothetical protein